MRLRFNWKKFAGRILLLSAISIFLFQVLPAYASMTDLVPTPDAAGIPENFRSVQNIVALIFKLIISVSGAIFVILLLIGGIQYLVSAGNDEATSKAKRMLLDAIIGLIIVLTAWAAGHWILGRLNNANQTTPIFNQNIPYPTSLPSSNSPI